MFFFFFNDTATTEIYTLSLHDALPIFRRAVRAHEPRQRGDPLRAGRGAVRHGLDPHPALLRAAARHLDQRAPGRSEEHTSELQSRQYLVCRLLLEKKKYSTSKLSCYYS